MQADIVLTNGAVITMNAERKVLPEGAVAIQEDKIIAVGTSAELAGQYQAQEQYQAYTTQNRLHGQIPQLDPLLYPLRLPVSSFKCQVLRRRPTSLWLASFP